MRGKVVQAFSGKMLHRITPAYAGKSDETEPEEDERWDHPRLCGEKTYTLPAGKDGTGSPPPMRGKDKKQLVILCDFGITPAYAGKSFISAPWGWTGEDHPRLCGEKL